MGEDLENVLDCEPIDLMEYESRQEEIVQKSVDKWLQR